MTEQKKKAEKTDFLKNQLDCLSKPYRVQSAAVLSVKDTPIEQMFQLSNRIDDHWGIEGYEVAKKHEDPLYIIKQREYSTQKKGQKNRNYVTKRGSYLEDLKKIVDQVPAPNVYDVAIKWKEANPKQVKPQSAPGKRQTFIDQIVVEGKLRPIPGAGRYNLEKPLKQKLEEIDRLKKIKIHQGQKPSYLHEYEHLAYANPGPGNYNPRQIEPKLVINKTKPKDFIAKHKSQSKKRLKSALPDMGSYNNHPCDYTTFGKLLDQKKLSKQEIKKNQFGKDERFKDPRQTKSKQSKLNPGPGEYPIIAQWPGKEDGFKQDKTNKVKNWMENISKGVQKSIYY